MLRTCRPFFPPADEMALKHRQWWIPPGTEAEGSAGRYFFAVPRPTDVSRVFNVFLLLGDMKRETPALLSSGSLDLLRGSWDLSDSLSVRCLNYLHAPRSGLCGLTLCLSHP